jgi:hypothetical protein
MSVKLIDRYKVQAAELVTNPGTHNPKSFTVSMSLPPIGPRVVTITVNIAVSNEKQATPIHEKV